MYEQIIQGTNPEVSVLAKACPLFVPLVEEGFKKHPVTDEIIDYYLAEMKESEIDALILGCTHYPLLRSKIREYVGEKITLVNPAYETAMDLRKILKEYDMENPDIEGDHGSYSFYVSDAADKFKQFANSILPYDIETTKQINIEEY
jgi:glutamate racemase